MEGVFHSPSSTTEFHFAQDSKRTSSDNNLPNLPLSDTRSIRSATASHMKSSHQSSDATPKLYSLTSISRAKSSLENNQTNLCINPPHHFNFLSGLKKWQNFSRKEEEDPFESTLQVADEEKEVLNVSGYCEEMRPSAGTQRNLTHRSKTPMSYRSKGSSTVRKDNPYPSPFISVQEGDDNVINNVIHGPENGGKESPKKIERYYSSSERYFQVKTGKIVERSMENRTSSGFKRASYSNRGSLMKMSKSRFGDSPRKSFHSTPKRLTRMDSLKDIKLTGSPNASSGAKLGISLVKETLEEVMEEKEQWRLRVEELKDAIKQEKVCLEKSQENVRYLTNHMGCLTRRSETLDRNTTGVQAQTYRLQEEVNQLQEEIRAYVEGLRNVVRQIEAEAQLVKYTKELNKSLKACVYEKTKQRDTYKTRAQSSKRSRNKSLEKYETAAKTQKTFATVLEDQFQRYAA